VNVISRQRIVEFIKEHKDSESSLMAWFKAAKKARWQHLAELKEDYPSADLVGDLTVFNIKGNDYRLIAYINYQYKQVLVRAIMTHQEYNKGKWKR
jgi:mRNA interferase HigB